MDQNKLSDAIASKWQNVYASNYDEAKDVLKDKYGEKGWIGALAQSIAGSDKKSGKEYKAVRRSIERYESGQNKSSKYSAKIPDLKEKLPPVGRRLPENKVTVTVKGTQGVREEERKRSWTTTFTGADAYTFAENPTYRDFFRAQKYPDWVIDKLESGEYEISVDSVVS